MQDGYLWVVDFDIRRATSAPYANPWFAELMRKTFRRTTDDGDCNRIILRQDEALGSASDRDARGWRAFRAGRQRLRRLSWRSPSGKCEITSVYNFELRPPVPHRLL